VTEDQDYDRLAADYHRIFPDWRETVNRQGEQLDRLIRAEMADRAMDVLDCSSGIGTQAIGLARRGHRVTASDISTAALERSTREGHALGVHLVTVRADIRQLGKAISGHFDVVLSCDNAISHLLTPIDLRTALEAMRDCLNPGGLLLMSLRDYRRDARGRPRATVPSISGRPGHRQTVFQLWDWETPRIYRPDLVFLAETSAGWQLKVYPLPRLRTWTRHGVIAQLNAAGLSDVRWRPAQETGFYQPIATGRHQPV
jgi:glycine/sarcosine N-methyltransferase